MLFIYDMDISKHAVRQGRSQNFQRGGGGSPADTNNYDKFDAPIALNTREV